MIALLCCIIQNIRSALFGFVTKHACDKTDGQNYDSQDGASIAASRSKKEGFSEKWREKRQQPVEHQRRHIEQRLATEQTEKLELTLNSNCEHAAKMWTYLNIDKSASAFSLLWMVEPLDAYKHGAVPRLPEADNSADVCHITSG